MDLSTLLLVPTIAVCAPVSAALLSRFAKIPLVVFEIVLGLVLGPAVLGWVGTSEFIDILAEFGLAMLFFMAGSEIDFQLIKGRPIKRASVGFLLSLAIGTTAGLILAPTAAAGVFVGIALANTALGTIMPVLRDAGEMRTPFGTAVTAVGAAGEFGPLIAISLFLSGRTPGRATVVLLAFTVIAAAGMYAASRGEHRGMHRLISTTLHTSGQFAIRLVILVLALLVGLSIWLGLDMLIGAFAAGILFRLLLAGALPEDAHRVESKIEAVAFGFLVPVFFIYTGITFDLRALLDDTRALVLLPVFLVLLLVVRGLPNLIAAPPGATAADRRALVLFGATALPIIVAITDIGADHGVLQQATAASMVGAGMLSVLLYPLLALGQRRRSATASAEPRPDDEDVPEEA
ncbi:cation:proton antiporter [Georgenia sp. SYP-B2076]|uniref:cation:proton antiporter n=1 Tax=Georgenia sp. SYP-B2076 TaxID=2495881 RepID=UPI00197A8420|nr:cation:proton antiporter [Georgenia sp. SYP-B2076]